MAQEPTNCSLGVVKRCWLLQASGRKRSDDAAQVAIGSHFGFPETTAFARLCHAADVFSFLDRKLVTTVLQGLRWQGFAAICLERERVSIARHGPSLIRH
jgi:hypothetical protein